MEKLKADAVEQEPRITGWRIEHRGKDGDFLWAEYADGPLGRVVGIDLEKAKIIYSE